MSLVRSFEPLGDWVLLERIPRGETAGGIALPDGATIDLPKAKVLAVGPGKMCEFDGKTMPMPVKPDDIVCEMTSSLGNSMFDFKEDGKEYVVMRAQHLVGRVKK